MTKATHYEFQFTVRGSGPFPIDMLRYDRAVPASEVDALTILRDGERSIDLIRFVLAGARPPAAVARWASFGWEVLP